MCPSTRPSVQPTHKQNHRPATQPTHATLQPGLQHAPGRPAKATFSKPDPLPWFQSPHRHVIPTKVPVRAAVCPFTQAARTQPYLRRAHARAMPCRPRPSALPPRPQQSGLASAANRDMCSTGQRRLLPTRHSAAVVPPEFRGLRPACGCKSSPRLAALREMLHPRCRHGPTRRHEVVTDGDARRWHQPALVVSGGSGRWSKEGQRREGARERCCGAVRM
jgi:hypothetical protein